MTWKGMNEDDGKKTTKTKKKESETYLFNKELFRREGFAERIGEFKWTPLFSAFKVSSFINLG